jgi:murein L,D-transpeptidase YafK
MKRRYRVLIIVVGVLVLISLYNFIPEYHLQNGAKVDSLVVYKSKRQLLAFYKGTVVETYDVSLGREPVGDKEYEGDNRTPEGLYHINDKNAHSRYHKNLGISYPDSSDIEYSRRIGRPPGGDIKIHGLRNGTGVLGRYHRIYDWTLGCIAVTNDEIDELFNLVDIGTPIKIEP